MFTLYRWIAFRAGIVWTPIRYHATLYKRDRRYADHRSYVWTEALSDRAFNRAGAKSIRQSVSGGSRGGAGGSRTPPLIFRPNWDPKGRPPPLISGSGWPPPPPLHPFPYRKVWIRQWVWTQPKLGFALHSETLILNIGNVNSTTDFVCFFF